MTLQELLRKINRSSALKVWDRINLDKIRGNIENSAYYADMDQQFLIDVSEMTGTPNGIVVQDNEIGFILNTSSDFCLQVSGATSRTTHVTPVQSIILNFDIETGKCTGFSGAVYQRDLVQERRPTDNALPEEEEFAIRQIIPALDRFTESAKEKLYILPFKM